MQTNRKAVYPGRMGLADLVFYKDDMRAAFVCLLAVLEQAEGG